MFTPEQLKEMQDTLRCVVQVIFEYEDSFIKHCVLGYDYKVWELERVHGSGSTFRITLKREDGRETDVYTPTDEVLHWFAMMQDIIIGKF